MTNPNTPEAQQGESVMYENWCHSQYEAWRCNKPRGHKGRHGYSEHPSWAARDGFVPYWKFADLEAKLAKVTEERDEQGRSATKGMAILNGEIRRLRERERALEAALRERGE